SLECVDEVDGVICAVGALVNTDVNVGLADGVAVLRGVTGQRLYPVLDFLPLPHLGGAVVADRQLGRDEHGELLPHALAPAVIACTRCGSSRCPFLIARSASLRIRWRRIARRSSDIGGPFGVRERPPICSDQGPLVTVSGGSVVMRRPVRRGFGQRGHTSGCRLWRPARGARPARP